MLMFLCYVDEIFLPVGVDYWDSTASWRTPEVLWIMGLDETVLSADDETFLTEDRVRQLCPFATNTCFPDWFESVSSGRHSLYPRDPYRYQSCLETGAGVFYADCVERNPENGIYYGQFGECLLEEHVFNLPSLVMRTYLPRIMPLPLPPTADPFKLEIDEGRSYYVRDGYGTDFKFCAVKADWLEGQVPVGFTPFFMGIDGQYHLYIPVKRH